MNTENNKRYMTTEENILNAYNRLASSKRVDQITVSDICRTAGIHRTSFYGHFQDIHTLQSKVDALQRIGMNTELSDLRIGVFREIEGFPIGSLNC